MFINVLHKFCCILLFIFPPMKLRELRHPWWHVAWICIGLSILKKTLDPHVGVGGTGFVRGSRVEGHERAHFGAEPICRKDDYSTLLSAEISSMIYHSTSENQPASLLGPFRATSDRIVPSTSHRIALSPTAWFQQGSLFGMTGWNGSIYNLCSCPVTSTMGSWPWALAWESSSRRVRCATGSLLDVLEFAGDGIAMRRNVSNS